MSRPLRILMVCHMLWDRNLGGPRVQVELADEFRSAGHRVDKFSFEDAFPGGRSRVGECLDPRAFARRAGAFVREHASDYDVIDAHQGNLPFAKSRLDFRGLLAARSVGLYSHYAAFARREASLWPGRPSGSRAGRALRGWRSWREGPAYLRSLRAADLINVCNRDELIYVRDVLKMGEKCVALPFGMSDARLDSFRRERRPPEVRQATQEVAFVGFWSPRKGSFDWGDIVRRVWAARPETRFLFLGTVRGPDAVLADLGIGPDDRVAVTPSYPTEDLPRLLRGATVGAFPSYIEGFPFGVLELLAAGLPTVAYDVPGSRELPSRVEPSWLVPAGDTGAFAARIIELLGARSADYRRITDSCIRTADACSWSAIAKMTLASYIGGPVGRPVGARRP